MDPRAREISIKKKRAAHTWPPGILIKKFKDRAWVSDIIQGDNFRIHNEGQATSRSYNLRHILVCDMGHVPKNREYYQPCSIRHFYRHFSQPVENLRRVR